MECPFCGSTQVMVTNSRPTISNSQVWRRRKCSKCKGLFTTHEIIDLSHLVVVKSSGKKEKYSRVKIYSGIYSSMFATSPSQRQKLAEKITGRVEKEILLLKNKEISSKRIAEIVLSILKKMSPGAFLAFLTYYKGIASQAQMKRELKKYLELT